MDKNVKHIAYYTRKVAEQGAIHPAKRDERWFHRHKRLLNYKKALHARISKEV
ncbi:hypothetical protein ACTHHL_04040 [Aeribacillus composti]|uniref:hypothetical protein n=1 Tax=Aeribacillus composti TaxID=1868734 RepID=UPI00406A4684